MADIDDNAPDRRGIYELSVAKNNRTVASTAARIYSAEAAAAPILLIPLPSFFWGAGEVLCGDEENFISVFTSPERRREKYVCAL